MKLNGLGNADFSRKYLETSFGQKMVKIDC